MRAIDLGILNKELQGNETNNMSIQFGGGIAVGTSFVPTDTTIVENNKNMEDSQEHIHQSPKEPSEAIGQAEYQVDCEYDITAVEGLNIGSVKYLDRLAARIRERPARTSSGIEELDRVLGGGWPCGLSVIAASPNVGKTTILLQSAAAMTKQGIAVVYLTHDMRELDLTAKVISHTSFKLYGEDCYTLNDILDTCVLGDGSEKSKRVIEEVARTQKYLAIRDLIYDPEFDSFCNGLPELSLLNRIERIFHVYSSVYKNVVFMVDSLQQVAPYQKGGARDSVDKQLREFKELSTLYEVPVVLISTLSRSSYSTTKDIDMSALKESGSIEYDADSAIILQPKFIKDEEKMTMDEFRELDYRDITIKSIKSRTSGYKEKTMTLYAPGCTFISYKGEADKSNHKEKTRKDNGMRKPNNSNFR